MERILANQNRRKNWIYVVDVLCVIPKVQIWPKLVMRLFNEFLNIVQVRQCFDLRMVLCDCLYYKSI